MSSRALKKLHQSNLSEVNDEEEDDMEPVKARSSVFALLDDASPLEDGNSSEEQEADCDKKVVENEADQVNRKKKKKKKRKKAAKANATEKMEDDIDSICMEINSAYPLRNPMREDIESSRKGLMDTKALLTVEHRNLNCENEMRRIFGSNVVDASHRRRGHRTYHRPTHLATPRDSWPQMMKLGLSMEQVEKKDGCQYYRFVHSSAYQQIQFEFLDAVESLDPENISAVLRMYPYHVDSLLQLSEICKMTDDRQMAAELTERALYSLECGFHTLFSLTSGTCRLDYRHPENRSFYLALFRHAVSVGQKGCHRTALEFCKLLLSLDPNVDPLCILLMIDLYALRAEEERFLLRLFSEWEPHRNLLQLPNWAFSIPLAMFVQEKYTASQEADKLLQKALIMFPSVLKLLLDKCGLVLNASVMNHPYYSIDSRDTAGLHHLISLFVARNYLLWKVPEVLAWLEANARVACEQVDANVPLVEECRKQRSLRYKGTPRNVYRHIVISDLSDATVSLPPEISQSPVMMFDPLPPLDSLASYSRPESNRRRQIPAMRNPLSLFVSSLMPSFDPESGDSNPDSAAGPVANFLQSLRELFGSLGGPSPQEDGVGPAVDDID
eukprot:m.52463 g.52463  ORF g.52463 m.52463 type:complete len:613 (+) comp34210_c0_seq2:12-1850(+)